MRRTFHGNPTSRQSNSSLNELLDLNINDPKNSSSKMHKRSSLSSERNNRLKFNREKSRKKEENFTSRQLHMPAQGTLVPKLDLEFEKLVREKKNLVEIGTCETHSVSTEAKISVCVRKRPIFEKEVLNGEIDCVSAVNPHAIIYETKKRIDGYTKYIDLNEFLFDNAYNEFEDTETLFSSSVI